MKRQTQPLTRIKRFQNWLLPRLFPGHMQEVDRMVGVFEDAYKRGGLLMPPQAIIQQLRENGQLPITKTPMITPKNTPSQNAEPLYVSIKNTSC